MIIKNKTGLVTLKKKVSPKFLYSQNNYNYRTSDGSKKQDINTFLNFIKKKTNFKKLKKIVDVGGNDFTLVKKFNDKKIKLYVIDPVGKKNKKLTNITLIKKPVENVNFKKIFNDANLIILRHTLEHISNPMNLMKNIFKNISSNTDIAIEVPNLDLMLKKKRLDALIHQHYFYFDKNTLSNLIISSGGRVKSFKNYLNGPCGGSMMLICKKSNKSKNKFKNINLKNKIATIRKTIKLFKIKMSKIKFQLKNKKNIYGFGAGLMLPTFIYHLGTNISILNCILDDNPKKHNFMYKNLKVNVVSTKKFIPKPNSNYLITSLENTKQIKQRIKKLKPKKIYTF